MTPYDALKTKLIIAFMLFLLPWLLSILHSMGGEEVMAIVKKKQKNMRLLL